MLTLQEITDALIKSDEDTSDENFVGAAVRINENGEAKHAGIIIKYIDAYYLFHFGPTLELQDLPHGEWYFHKNVNFIKSEEIPSFLAYCKLIDEDASPVYGYYYNGSYFTAEGQYFSEINTPQYMTCVGFCLNVLNGFLQDHSYLNFREWDGAGIPQRYINEIIEKFRNDIPDMDENRLFEDVRRISPDDYLASAYINEIPVSKGNVDAIIENISQAIYNTRNGQI